MAFRWDATAATSAGVIGRSCVSYSPPAAPCSHSQGECRMAQIRTGIDGGAREVVRLRAPEEGQGFEKAKDLAKRKAREICAGS